MLLEFIAVLASMLLGYLFLLVLFERGIHYRTSEPVHDLDDEGRMRLLTAILATPAHAIHSLEVLEQGTGLYEKQLQSIRDARHSIHLEAYILHRGHVGDAFLEAMCERARSRVRVRVTIDGIGSIRTRQSYFASLIAAGGSVHRYHPLRWHMFRRWNSRTHRNLLVVDGEVAFIGGAGVADHWDRSAPAAWRDYVARVTGPIVVGLQSVFAENWLECAGEVLVGQDSFATDDADVPVVDSELPLGLAIGSTPTAGGSTRARVLLQFLLATARESIDLCSPYFIPDFGIRRELLAAHERGVRVRILTGGPYGDHGIVRRAGRRRYGPLLTAGIEIREYAPRMMHSKLLLVDGRWTLLGSTNVDPRSFGLNDEVNLVVVSSMIGARLRTMFEEDLADTELVSLARWKRRSLGERLLAHVGRLIERHQ